MIKSFFIPIFEKGRGNAAHTRYTRPHRQGRAQAQEKGGADEEEIPQEADRHRETVRRRYYDTTEIKVLPRYLCRSDSEIRATKGYKRLEDSSQVHAAVLSGYTETRRQSQSGGGGFATAKRNGTGGTKTGEKRNTDCNARQGKAVGVYRGTLLGGTRTEIHHQKGWVSSTESPNRRDEIGSCH